MGFTAADETTEPTTQRQLPGWCAWVGLGLLTLTIFMAAIDMTVVFLAIPEIAADLQPGATQQLWVLHVGDLLGAGLVLTAGRLAERYGARRLLALGLVGYGSASLVAALATSVEMLIVARALLGAATVTFTPAGMMLVRGLFPDNRRFARAVGIYMAGFSGGMALGPPLGGALLDAFSWNAIFLINVPVAIGVLLSLRLLPRTPGTGHGRLDLVSAVLALLAVGLLVNGVQEAASRGPGPVEVGSAVAGLLLGVVFVRRQRRLTDPLLDLALFRRPAFTFALVGIVGVIVATTGAEMQISQHLQVAQRLTPLQAGTALMVPASLSILGTVVAPLLLRWLTPRAILAGGALVAAAGTALVALVAGAQGASGTTALLVGASVAELGVAPMFGLGAGLVAASVPAERVASASAVQDVSGGLGNTLGLTLGGTLAFVVFQSALGPRLPAELSAAEAGAATDSAGGALATAERLGGDLGADVVGAAQAALTSSTQSLYAMAAGLLVVLAVVLVRGLRGVRIEDEAEPEPSGEALAGQGSGVGSCPE